METAIKTTPLNSWHRAHGANMADFGGFDMPLWYDTGVKTEHLAVIRSAGIFDTSHMASVMVNGDGAFDLLQYCHTRDMSDLSNGRCVYGAILNKNGHVIDDAIVYRLGVNQYMVCVNAGMGSPVAAHLRAIHSDNSENPKTKNNNGIVSGTVDIQDLSEKLGKLDIQGKNAARVLAKLLQNPDTVFNGMPYFSFKGHFDETNSLSGAVRLKNGTPILLSRSGYTGEFGFEIFITPSAVVDLWEDLLHAGADFDVIACGLGARDSLRAGAMLPLSHQDIGNWKFIHHPWMFALPLTSDGGIKFTKSFLGDQALLDPADTCYTLAFAGENLKKVAHGPNSQVLDENGTMLGTVLTCATDMAIGRHNGKILSIASPNLPVDFKARGISCGFIRVDRPLEMGTRLVLQEKKRKINVTVVADVRPHRTARQKIDHFLD